MGWVLVATLLFQAVCLIGTPVLFWHLAGLRKVLRYEATLNAVGPAGEGKYGAPRRTRWTDEQVRRLAWRPRQLPGLFPLEEERRESEARIDAWCAENGWVRPDGD